MENNPPQKLPILRILSLALDEVLRNHKAILKGCLLPWAIVVVVSHPDLAIKISSLGWIPGMILGALLSMFTAAMMGVTCHRIFLLGPRSLANEWGLTFGHREARYLWISILFAIMGVGFTSVPVMLLYYFLPLGSPLATLASAALVLVVLYFLPRLSLLFPATAIDQAWTFRACLAITKPHRIRLLGLMLVSGLITGVPVFIIVKLMGVHQPLLVWLFSIPTQLLGFYNLAVLSLTFQFVCPDHLRPKRESSTSDG